jgi:hypothetical protein
MGSALDIGQIIKGCLLDSEVMHKNEYAYLNNFYADASTD